MGWDASSPVAWHRVGETLKTGTAAAIRDSATARLGNRRVASRDRGIFVSLESVVQSQRAYTIQEVRVGGTARDSACRACEPAAEKCTCHSFRRRATLPLG